MDPYLVLSALLTLCFAATRQPRGGEQKPTYLPLPCSSDPLNAELRHLYDLITTNKLCHDQAGSGVAAAVLLSTLLSTLLSFNHHPSFFHRDRCGWLGDWILESNLVALLRS